MSGGSQAGSGPPPDADPRLWYWFNAIDTDKNGKLTVEELQVWHILDLVLDSRRLVACISQWKLAAFQYRNRALDDEHV